MAVVLAAVVAVVLAVDETAGVAVAIAEAAITAVAVILAVDAVVSVASALAVAVTLAVVVLLAVSSATIPAAALAAPTVWPWPWLWPCLWPPLPWPSLWSREDRAFWAAARAAGRDGYQPQHGCEPLTAAAT